MEFSGTPSCRLCSPRWAYGTLWSTDHFGWFLRPAVASGRIPMGSWCPALRERYHVEACNGMNYLRAGEETTDPCLGRLLKELGEESYRQADQLMALLERAL